MVPDSDKGKTTKKRGRTPVPIDITDLRALQPSITGRDEDAALLERWRAECIPNSTQWRKRAQRGPWQSASELYRPWDAIRERAGLPAHIVPYALRHSSIVRRIRLNMPIHLVAAIHDTSVEKIE